MGFRMEVKRSQIYMESDENFNNNYFGYKVSKFYHNIDTFYYTVSLRDDFNKNPDVNDLLYELSEKKNQFIQERELVYFSDKLYCCNGRFDDIYEYRLTNPDKYDIFITSYLPNSKTPRIVVQLRSSALWIDGVKDTIEDSYYQLVKLLGSFGLEISQVYENRIDYCYHTNYIQDMYSFFEDKKVIKQLKGNMRNWRKDGHIFEDGWDMNYFALGSRNSNNVFIRIYDKTREVVELQYKGFFLEIWFQEGLISYYDKYVLEYAYKHSNYEKRFEGMLYFYLEFGRDELHKKEITHYLEDTDLNFNEIKKLALSLCPQTTTIVNIEFQTKRKFYSSGDNLINALGNIIKTNDKLSRLTKIVDNRKIFLDYITHHNIRFVEENGEYKNWWKRLRGLKMDILDTGKEYARDYQRKLDKDKLLTRAVRTTATHALYKDRKESNFFEDVSDLICTLNDNDVKFLNDYSKYKEKKYISIKNQISKTEISEN